MLYPKPFVLLVAFVATTVALLSAADTAGRRSASNRLAFFGHLKAELPRKNSIHWRQLARSLSLSLNRRGEKRTGPGFAFLDMRPLLTSARPALQELPRDLTYLQADSESNSGFLLGKPGEHQDLRARELRSFLGFTGWLHALIGEATGLANKDSSYDGELRASRTGHERWHSDGTAGDHRTTMSVEGAGSASLIGPTVAALTVDGRLKTLRLWPWQRAAAKRTPSPPDAEQTDPVRTFGEIVSHFQPWLTPPGVALIFAGESTPNAPFLLHSSPTHDRPRKLYLGNNHFGLGSVTDLPRSGN